MRQKVRALINDTLTALKNAGTLKLEQVPGYTVEAPKNPAHGDWSVNVAMMLTKPEGKPPRDIAQAIVKGLVDPQGIVTKAEVAGPGFLNFTLKEQVHQQVAREVLLAGETFGHQAPKSTGKRVMVEFVSANPTGPVHIGHARGAFMGDAVSRLLEAAGHDVTREFYINDYGKQVETLGRTVHKRYRQLFGQHVELGEGEYPAEYVIDIAKGWKEAVGERYLHAPESEWLPEAMAVGIRENLKAIRDTLQQANIRHDVFFSEASLHASGKVLAVVEEYKQRGATYEAAEAERTGEKVRHEDSKAAQYTERQRGGTFLRTSQHGDDEDRIILRHDGTPVYLTADLAYHQEKYRRGFDRIIDVLGADHAGHTPRISAGMALLGLDVKKLEFLLVQLVRITRGGEEVKVSKRKGTVFELEDLIHEAGADVCRFLFLVKTANSRFDFDLDLVKKQSKDNPVFYFQYGHARCASILKKAAEKGTPFVGLEGLTPAHLARLTLPEELSMLKKMSQLPDVVASAAERLEPHHVLYFCQELITDFHSYYTKYKTDPIISGDADKTQGRLGLVAALKQTLRSAFALLGIQAPEYMEAPPDEE
ncbi:arginine--tRNA ligase [Stigmatella sp. ncwal1]|uniref:Arginine--tRNA ligase n=1 Tax=Stigmatella ashevillensis TaxID=2995309 RepID=A0ABT5DAW9_9BACT|nr:arginine--tRNA ligase [Stigmatella ashevillena]MDC0710676.1 arginine--tRNA ligase [Stigmatella ashevillena]